MELGVHLPLMQLDPEPLSPQRLGAAVDAARDCGFAAVAANDHFVFAAPWLDGPTALASVIERSGALELATTIALAVPRSPVPLAKALGAIDLLSGGRLVAALGPGSSPRDYEAVGVPFAERWKRFDEAIPTVRALLAQEPCPPDAQYCALPPDLVLAPGPRAIPLWVASWGSPAGLARVARAGDGWLASAYNAGPTQVAAGRQRLGAELSRNGRTLDGFPCALATMWTYVTEDDRERRTRLDELAAMLNRPAESLAGQMLVGPVDHCAAVVRAYADAGVDRLFIWPLADAERQLERFMREVVPAVGPS